MTPVPRYALRLLRRAARALAWNRARLWAVRGLTVTAAVSTAWTLAGAVIPLPLPPWHLLVAGLAVCLLTGLVRGLLPAGGLLYAAQVADVELRLRERLSTALELATGRLRPTALAGEVLRDAEARARDALPGMRLRLGWPSGTRRALVAVGLATLAAVILPGFTLPATPARETAVRIKREGQRLQRVAGNLEQRARAERAPQARRLAPEVRGLAEELQRQRLDRRGALARIAALERRLEAARRQLGRRIGEAINTQTPEAASQSLFRPSAALEQTIRELRELAARLSQVPEGEGREDLLRHLGELARAAEAQMPAQARRALEEARRRTEAGDADAGQRALAQAIAEMDALRALVADESVLRMAEQELERSALSIARGAGPEPSVEAQRGEVQAPPPGSVAHRLPDQEEAASVPPPPRGPDEGSAPGQGRLGEKLGPQTPRLDAPGERSRVVGQEGEGQLLTTELLGPGRRVPARAPVLRLSPQAARRADEHMAAARIPAALREVVRRYFLLLAERR